MKRKAIFANTTFWGHDSQVGIHHLAREYCNAGWEVAFLGGPVSPLHWLKRDVSQKRERFALCNKGSSDLNDQLWSYVPFSLTPPYHRGILSSTWVFNHWMDLTWPNLIKQLRNHGFGEVDHIILGSPLYMPLLDHIKHKASCWRLADMSIAFDNCPQSFKDAERKLAQRVDTLFYTAQSLRSYVNSLDSKQPVFLPNAVCFDHFSQPVDKPQEYYEISKPIAVYVGLLENWFDASLLLSAAQSLADLKFVIIGPITSQVRHLDNQHNIRLLGAKSFSILPQYLQHADVGLIPFNVKDYGDLVHHVNPLKLYEYFAAGLPVVSTRWEELDNIKSPAILAETTSDFIGGIQNLLNTKQNARPYRLYAEQFSWENTCKVVQSTLDQEGVLV